MTDIFLPKRLADNIANIYGPLFAIALILHGRNLWRARRDGDTGGQPGMGG